jgi:hypothetical protein
LLDKGAPVGVGFIPTRKCLNVESSGGEL